MPRRRSGGVEKGILEWQIPNGGIQRRAVTADGRMIT